MEKLLCLFIFPFFSHLFLPWLRLSMLKTSTPSLLNLLHFFTSLHILHTFHSSNPPHFWRKASSSLICWVSWARCSRCSLSIPISPLSPRYHRSKRSPLGACSSPASYRTEPATRRTTESPAKTCKNTVCQHGCQQLPCVCLNSKSCSKSLIKHDKTKVQVPV